MRHYFFDTSSLAKLFIVEPGTTRVRAIFQAAKAQDPGAHVALCDLAHPEAVAALRQIVQRGEGGRRGISPAALRRTLPELATLLSGELTFSIVQASAVIAQAAEVAARYHVKGADAVHIAAALRLHRRLAAGEEFWFVSADVRQGEAARQEGMPVLDPTA